MVELLDQLKSKYASLFEQCSSHSFNTELCNGTLSDSKLYVYLVMDLTFFMNSLRMISKTAALCDNDKALLRLGKQVGELCRDENDYFDHTLADLRVNLHSNIEAKGEPPLLPEVDEYIRFLDNATNNTTYVENITAIYIMELSYLKWAEIPDPNTIDQLEFKHSQWVKLHSGESFEEWVGFLESEVSRVLNEETLPIMELVFKRALELEIMFFDACYNYNW